MTDALDSPAPPAGIRVLAEEPRPGALPAVHRADWTRTHPWLQHGITTRGDEGAPFDLRLRGPAAGEEVLRRWEILASETRCGSVVHARQVHGAAVRTHRAGSPGLHLTPPCDGHLTADAGILLTVSLADCVPVFLVDPGVRALALLHAGWRGIAAGIIEAGVGALQHRFGADPGRIEAHVGPAIGGGAYEVGPEVHRSLGLADPGRPAPVDLRSVIRDRLGSVGVLASRTSLSTLDTLGDPRFFSHRGGDVGRHVAFLARVEGSEASA